MNTNINTIYKSLLVVCGAALISLATTIEVSAYSAASQNYKIDDGAINSFGGDASSANYKLTDSGGEAFIGPGSSQNYKFNAGYVASLEHSISISLDALSVTIPNLTPGTSQTAQTVVTVYTDAAGYLLGIRQDANLTHTSGSTSINGVPGTIDTPALWTEGTTQGLGFSLIAGTSVESKWGSNPNYKYAALPTTATTFHDKPNYQNTNDTNTIQYRLDTAVNQLAGTYRNNVTYSAVVKP